ncbi:MAG TPA: hypothetical protein VH143_23065 [Kofleriaceae bacterium]|jgi:hypothetical protein|nr:hypothetical protein [Kofleriaceae bacterium]
MLPEARTVRDALVEPPPSDESRFEAELAAMTSRARRRQLVSIVVAGIAVVAAGIAAVAIAFGHDGNWEGSNRLFDASVALTCVVLVAIGAAFAHRVREERKATSSARKSRRPQP